MPDLVLLEQRGPVSYLTINREDKRNALNHELVQALTEALDRLAMDESVRVIVLGGAGRVFSAGADLASLQALQEATPMQNVRDSRHLARLFEAIYLHPKPILAKVHGHAIAGGCGLAAVCDISIAARSAKFGFTEVRIGFVPAIVMVFVVRKLGEAAARDLLLRGRLLEAEEAAACGLITEAVAAERLAERVDEVARELASETSASAVALTKRMLAQVRGMGLHEALDLAVQTNAFARGTADCRAGISAFLNKQDPPWRRDS